MKKRTFAICAAAAMVLGSLSFASAQGGLTPPVNQDDLAAHQVYICHLAGHDRDRLVGAGGRSCVNQRGGIILRVSKTAACKGHKVEDPMGWADCDNGD